MTKRFSPHARWAWRGLMMAALVCLPLVAKAQINIVVDESAKGVDISPMLYGIFYEDINHAADGGIYAELVRNRSFEDDAEEATSWEPYLSVNGDVKMTIDTKNLLNDAQHQCLHVVTSNVGDTDAGVLNTGFWGINAVKGRKYELSLWLKVVKGKEFYAILKGKNGTHLYASTRLDVAKEKGWQHITATLDCTANDKEAILVITSKGNSDFYLDVVSLFPPTYKNRPNGLRPDLAEMLYELHPAFMRFPGGCFVEGQETPDNAFRWERTIGPIEERPGHENRNWGYRTSDGLGFHEYLQLAEDLNAKPLYVCNIGIWHGGVTPVDEVQPWIDECLGAIEYANGPVSSKYGALRAKYGHPEPFNLEYIEIGNENNNNDGAQTSDHYYDRYRLFREAILAKYPNMHIIGDVASWGTDDPRWNSDQKVDLVDEHYYRSPSWFASNFEKYDAYSRSWPDVYCGEYAVTIGFGTIGDLNAALGEAVYMMGFENNSDIVKMSSYAPIFVNENDARWRPDMVRFNNHSVMGTPSYYVQKLMADNRGDKSVVIKEGKKTVFPVKEELTPAESHVGVTTWDTQATFKDIKVVTDNGTVECDCKNLNDFEIRLPRDMPSPPPGFELPTSTWEISGEGLEQTSARRTLPAILKTPIQGRKYTITLKARKNAGSEGFIVAFNYVGHDSYCWLTFGSMSNSSHVIEQGVANGRLQISRAEGKIETGHWYDVKIDVDGNNVTAYLDGQEVVSGTLQGIVLPGIFSSASTADNGKEMIVKIVNTSAMSETANLDLGTFKTDGGTLIQMKSASGEAENTLLNPTNVYPTTKRISLDASNPQFVVEPYSLNIIRLKKK